jgi:hypothetical protein
MGCGAVTAQTPIFGLKYPVVGESIYLFRQCAEDNAKAIEAAMAPRTLNTNISSLNDEIAARQAQDTTLQAAIQTNTNAVAAINAGLQETAPTDLAYYAGGTNFGAGYRNLCFWRTYKTVFVAGMAKIVGSLAAGAGVQLVGLPAGYRPASIVPAPVLVNGTGVGRLDVQPGGDLVLTNTSGAAYTAGSYVPVNLAVPIP